VVAGKAVYLAKGERVKWVFPEGGAEYVSAAPVWPIHFNSINVKHKSQTFNPRPWTWNP